MKKSLLCLAALLITSMLSFVSASASGINVKLDSIVSDNTIHIDFDTVAPMTIENSTVIPLRKFCESAGLKVGWSDTTKTAYVNLKADNASSLPIEKYAYRLLQKADTKGLPLTPESITVSMTVADENIKVKYNYKDYDGDTVSLGTNIVTDVPATIISGGSIVAPIRSLMEAFGLWVEWDNYTVTVSIPHFDCPTEGLMFVLSDSIIMEENQEDIWYGSIDEPGQAVVVQPGAPIPENAIYLGNFKITHYCACSKCCGSYGNATAWAGKIVPGTTIAVDPKVIPKLSNVYIDGYGYRRAEDCGGAIKGNKIDVAVSSHSEALNLGVTYKDVWLLK